MIPISPRGLLAEALTITSTNDVTITDIEELVAGEGAIVSGSAKGDISVTTDAPVLLVP